MSAAPKVSAWLAGVEFVPASWEVQDLDGRSLPVVSEWVAVDVVTLAELVDADAAFVGRDAWIYEGKCGRCQSRSWHAHDVNPSYPTVVAVYDSPAAREAATAAGWRVWPPSR